MFYGAEYINENRFKGGICKDVISLTHKMQVPLLSGVVLLLSIAHMFLSTVLPNWVYVEESYKKAKEFYQSLSHFEPYCDVPMHIEGSYDRATITYNFDFKPCSYS